jgi:hypothetical protein
MFYLQKDNMTVCDSFGDKVGFLIEGKFSQVLRVENKIDKCSKRYASGLVAMELEQISELMQKVKGK